jgi:uncharacterized protein
MPTTDASRPPADFAHAMDDARRPSGLVVGTIVAVAITLAIFGAGRVLRLLWPELIDEGGIVGLAVAFLVAWILLWAWLRGKEERPFASVGFRRPSRAGLRILRGAAVALVQLTLFLLVGTATGSLSFVSSPTGPVQWAALGWVLVALVAYAVQSGAEEIIARGYLVQVWHRRTGVIGAVVVSTLYFTAAHLTAGGYTPLAMLDMALYSIAAVLWVLAEGGLYGIIAYHAVWNWAQGSLFGIAVSGSDVPQSLFLLSPSAEADPLLTGGEFGAEGSLVDVVFMAALALCAAVAYLRSRRSRGHADASRASTSG